MLLYLGRAKSEDLLHQLIFVGIANRKKFDYP